MLKLILVMLVAIMTVACTGESVVVVVAKVDTYSQDFKKGIEAKDSKAVLSAIANSNLSTKDKECATDIITKMSASIDDDMYVVTAEKIATICSMM